MIDLPEVDDLGDEVRSLTEGRGADAVIDAVGMEAHGSPVAEMGQRLFNVLPKRLSASMMNKAGVDRMSAIYTAIDAVRRGGTVSLIGVYGGQTDPMPMLRCSTSSSSSGWDRRTSSAGSTTSCRC